MDAPPAARLSDDLLREGAPRRRRGRSALLAVLGLAVAAALAAGGWAGTAYLRDGDLRAALALSVAALDDVVRQADAADGAADLVRLAGDAEAASQELGRARARALRGHGADGRLVVAELDAQRDVLGALLPLEGAGRGALQAWGRARLPLGEALRVEARARARLGRERPQDAARLGVLDRLAPALDRAAVPLLGRAARAELSRLTAVLQDARTTADVRAAAEVAAEQVDAVRRTAGVAGDASDEVARCAAVLDALRGLTELSGARPQPWRGARERLAAGLGAGPGVPAALEHVDRLVAAATGAQQQYLAQRAAAASAREAEAAALAAHGATVRGLASGYGPRDAALVALLDALVARRATAADLAALAEDAAARARVAAALTALVAPPALVAEHASVTTAATAEAAAVQALSVALAGGTSDDAVLGRLVLRRSQATQGRLAALRAWDAAAVRAAALVDKRPPPEPPAL